MAKVNWSKIERDYVTGKLGQIALAEKYGVSKTCMAQKCTSGNWVEKRKEYRRKTEEKAMQKIQEKVIEKEVDRATRILQLSDRLTDKLEKAIDELDVFVSKDKTKIKEIEYDLTGQKPIREVVEEVERIKEIHTAINVLQAQQIATALKTLKDINMSIGTADEEIESNGLIEAINAASKNVVSDDSDMLPQED